MILVLLACALMAVSYGAEARTYHASGDRGTAVVSAIISAGFAILGVASCL